MSAGYGATSARQLNRSGSMPIVIIVLALGARNAALMLAYTTYAVMPAQASARDAYRDPEAHPGSPPSPDADVFALGITMLQLLVGQEALGLRAYVAGKLVPDSSNVTQIVDPCCGGWPTDSATRFARLAMRYA